MDGKLDLGAQGKSDALFAPPDSGRVLNAPADYVSRYARFAPERFWQNVNVSPDLPTVGAVAIDVWNQAGRPPVKGVIAVDPIALAAILRITGPITVPQWPVPITADNVVDVTLKQAYVAFPGNDSLRDDFLGDVTKASWQAFSSRDLGSPSTLLKALGTAVREKHIMVWFDQRDEEQLVRRSGAAGAVSKKTNDLLMVTTQNSAANKLDTYLKREVSYDATLIPTTDGNVAVKGAVDVTLQNNTPGGLPVYVQGPNAEGLAAGDNRTFVSVYTPLTLSGARFDSNATSTESATELGRNVFSTYEQLKPADKRLLTLFVAGEEPLAPGGWYELEIPHQAGVDATPTHILLTLPSGWKFVRARGMQLQEAGHRATFDQPVDRDLTLRLKIARDYGSGLWGRLEAGSNR